MSFAEYSEIQAVHWSGLKHMKRSPMHYQYRIRNPQPDNNAMALGRGCHTAVLEPEKLLTEYAVYRGESQRKGTNEWKAFIAKHPEETVLKIEEYERVLAIAKAVRAHPVAAAYLARGKPEQTIVWTDAETGLPCKGRIDWLGSAVVDLKSTTNVDAQKFAAIVARMYYHAQAAFYVDGVKAAFGLDLPAVDIAVEVDAPHDIGVFVLGDDELQAGREEYQALLRQVAICRQKKSWPGKYPEEMKLRLPSWSFVDEESDNDLADVIDFPQHASAEV